MAVRLRARRDTLANWQDANPILGDGEFAVAKDGSNLGLKLGDGVSDFKTLAYWNPTEVIDNLDSEATDKPLSANQGRELNIRVLANDDKITNVSTDLSITISETTVVIESSDGNNATLTAASSTSAGIMTKAFFDKLDAIESDATADQTGTEIKTAYENNDDTNALTDAKLTEIGHDNRAVLDKHGEDADGKPTYNGNAVDTTIAQRDVYDGLDSTDNAISLSAKQGKALKDEQVVQQEAIDLNTAKETNVNYDDTALQVDINTRLIRANMSGVVSSIINPLFSANFNSSLDMNRGSGGITFVRDSEASHLDKVGNLNYNEVGVPKFERGGLVMESFGENIKIFSQTFTDSSFTYTETDLTFNQPNIDGSTDAVKVTINTEDSSHTMSITSFLAAPDSTVTSSVTVEYFGVTPFLNINSGNFASWETRGDVVFDLENGLVVSATTATGAGTISGHIEDLGNNVYRCELRGQIRNEDVKNSHAYLGIRETASQSNYVGDGASGIIVHNTQVEERSTASSYTKTDANTKTRNADLCSIDDGANMPSGEAGSFFMDIMLKAPTKSYEYIFNQGDSPHRFTVYTRNIRADDPYLTIALYSPEETNTVSIPYLSDERFKLAITWGKGIIKAFKNGILVESNDYASKSAYSLDLMKKCYLFGNYDNDGYSGTGVLYSIDTYEKEFSQTEILLKDGK